MAQPGDHAPLDGAAPALARLTALSKIYENGTAALAGLDLTIRAGETLALVGASGCGKSTLLRILAGLIEPTSGTVAWQADTARGTHISHAGPPAMGFVFQDATLMPWANVAANVALPLSLRGETRRMIDGRVAAVLALVGLSGVAASYPRELSGGMKMRVSIARALIDRPSLLLMDEPFAALDEMTRFRLNDELHRLKHETGTTIVFVTHSIYEAVYLADRVAVMTPRPGRIASETIVDGAGLRDRTFRDSPAFFAACERVSAGLNTAMREVA